MIDQWEVYGMLAAVIEETAKDSRTAMAMEREADNPERFDMFLGGYDAMCDHILRTEYEQVEP